MTKDKITEELTMWLHKHQDAPQLVDWVVRHHHDNIAAADEALGHIRRLWRVKYGDATVQASDKYTSGLQYVLAQIQAAISEAQSSNERHGREALRERVLLFHNDYLSYSDKYELQASGRLRPPAPSFSGSRAVDTLLARLVLQVQPAFVEALRVPPRHHPDHELHTASAAATTLASPSTTRNGSDAVTAHTVKQRQPKSTASGGAGGSTQPATKLSASNASSKCASAPPPAPYPIAMLVQVATMIAIVEYPRAKPFELVCALAFMSGRSLAEILRTAEFAAGKCEHYPELQFRQVVDAASGSNGSQPLYTVIPVLCKPLAFLRGLHRLRAMKAVTSMAPTKDIYKGHCKTANTAAKALLGGQHYVFTDLRVAYAIITYHMYGASSAGAVSCNGSDGLKQWIPQCLPQTRVAGATAFIDKCCRAHLNASKGSNCIGATEAPPHQVLHAETSESGTVKGTELQPAD
ncbi:hypothetical protein JKP88DRAFT_245376 [Tribonema minus]|uniref:Uncharacterized protein n=1 Tax=Tribonema minus TaxID=303371 RepID=A0A835YWM0_9STRA|nr:hypothetical protein JKP88DRAFT_245376 [Tribonema minus]